jgi:hypothetical protein
MPAAGAVEKHYPAKKLLEFGAATSDISLSESGVYKNRKRRESRRHSKRPNSHFMPRVKTESLKEGMKVDSDVKNIDGMLLIPSGCELTERQIGILEAWGIAEVEVSGADTPVDTDPLAKLPPETLAKWTAEVKAVFWQPDEASPVYVELLKQLLLRRARRSRT